MYICIYVECCTESRQDYVTLIGGTLGDIGDKSCRSDVGLKSEGGLGERAVALSRTLWARWDF